MNPRGQILLIMLTALVFPLSMAPLELQRRIINDAINGADVDLLLLLGGGYLAYMLVHGGLKFLMTIEALRRIDEDNNRRVIASKLLSLGRAEEAFALLDEDDAWISGGLADDFARALGDYAVQERIVDRWLAVNPLTPRHLAMSCPCADATA